MTIFAKLLVTTAISFFITWIFAFPTTSFTKRGIKKFGSYDNFLYVIGLIHVVIALLIILLMIWI